LEEALAVEFFDPEFFAISLADLQDMALEHRVLLQLIFFNNVRNSLLRAFFSWFLRFTYCMEFKRSQGCTPLV
jgi:hypothetical protein